jgi:T-complex protein 1 subunit theta
MAAQNQSQEIGDGTTQVVALIGELLLKIKPLITMRLPIRDIQDGLDLSLTKALELLPSLTVETVSNIRDLNLVTRALKPVIHAKLPGLDKIGFCKVLHFFFLGHEVFVTSLVAKACLDINKEGTVFNVDNVRFAKILGGSLLDSAVVRGFCIPREAEGSVRHVKNGRIAVFGCAIDRDEGETKGTIVLNTAEELSTYTAAEEQRMKSLVNTILSTGANVVVTGSTVSEIALHYLDARGAMVVKVPSKFDLRRFCLTTGATALVRLGTPTPEELGSCVSIDVQEVGSNEVLIVSQEKDDGTATSSRIATIVLRSATQAQLDDVERVCIDAVNTYKVLTRDARLVAGGGAFEMELSRRVGAYGSTTVGLQQYGIGAFADALQVLPRVLAETAGLDANETITQLIQAHAQGKENEGVDIDALAIGNMKEKGVFDSLLLKEWVLRYAVDTTKAALSVDEIIMSKPAGLKPPGMKTSGAADDD